MNLVQSLVRWIPWILGAVLFVLSLYVLSFGPASAWVTSAIVGREPTEADVARYDARLYRLFRFYDPLLQVRGRLFYTAPPKIEEILSTYENWFSRPCRVADGRKVTTADFGSLIQPGETTEHYIQKLGGASEEEIARMVIKTTPEIDIWPKPGTRVFALPKNNLSLIIFSKDDDSMTFTIVEAAHGSWHGGRPTASAELLFYLLD